MATELQEVLTRVCWLYRERAAIEAEIGPEAFREAIEVTEHAIASMWYATAFLRARDIPGAKALKGHPGYVAIPAGKRTIHVPFHLVPALPDVGILSEVLALAEKISLGGREARICLSGSTLLLGDFGHAGDVDFCEYHPKQSNVEAMRAAFARLIDASEGSRFLVGMRGRETPEEPFQQCEISSPQKVTPQQVGRIAELMSIACNGKLAFLTATKFGGVLEATNWIVFHVGPVDSDPASRLSYAFQEAPLGLSVERSLTTSDSLAAYLNFLVGEIKAHSEDNPVKAIKRAISLLRLLNRGDLVDELQAVARKHRAFAAAAALARADLHRHYELRSDLGGLVGQLRTECEQLAEQVLGRKVAVDQVKTALNPVISKLSEALKKRPSGSIWKRILAVAPTP